MYVIYVCMYVYKYACMYLYVCMYINMHVCIYMYVYIYVCVCVCVYIGYLHIEINHMFLRA